MALKVITQPATEPVTNAEADLWIRYTGSLQDNVIDALITAARLDVESWTNRTLVTTTYEYYTSDLCEEIQIPTSTVQSIASITYIDSNGDTLNRAFWLINRDVMAKLPLMTVGDVPITWESYFRDGMIGFLNGLPVYQSEDCEALGTQGDVRLINPAGYRVLEKVGGEQFASSIHVKFDYDLTAFRWTHRINGISWSNAVYTPRKGATLSPFVELN